MARTYDEEVLRRAVRLYRIPGVHAAEVCERLGVSAYALNKARKSVDLERYPWPRDLLLSALTDTGKRTSGTWPDDDELGRMASYFDFVNKDGSTARTVERMLDDLVRCKVLRRAADRFELLQPFP